jgi:hypothetical protein
MKSKREPKSHETIPLTIVEKTRNLQKKQNRGRKRCKLKRMKKEIVKKLKEDT